MRGIAAVGVAAVAGLALVAARFPRVRVTVDETLMLIAGHASPHWLLFCAGQLLVAACGVLPASVMAVMAGAFYGFGAGLAISVAATMLGGWLAFGLSRSIFRPWIDRALHNRGIVARLDQAVVAEGWRFVCLMRVSPVMPFAATSYGLGLTRINQRAYLLGTLASLPSMAGFVAFGAFGKAGVVDRQFVGGPMQVALMVVGLAMIAWAILRLNAAMRTALVPSPQQAAAV